MGAQGGGRIEVAIDSTPDDLIRFVHDLLNDPTVRAEYEANPAKVLASYGVHLKGQIPKVTAPPTATLQTVHTSLTASGTDVVATCLSFGG